MSGDTNRVINDLKALIAFGQVNELQSIEDVANNAITEIKKLRADVQRLQRDYDELDIEHTALYRDLEKLCLTHNPCMICCNTMCQYRNPNTEIRCDDISWRGVCEENTEVRDATD